MFTIMQLIDTLFNLREAIPNIHLRTSSSQNVSFEDCQSLLNKNLHLLQSMWNAGCGWDNFSKLLQNFAEKLKTVPVHPKSLEEFISLWDNRLTPYEDHGLQYAYTQLLKKNATVEDAIEDFSILLYTLC